MMSLLYRCDINWSRGSLHRVFACWSCVTRKLTLHMQVVVLYLSKNVIVEFQTHKKYFYPLRNVVITWPKLLRRADICCRMVEERKSLT